MTEEETTSEEFICYICGEDYGGPTDYCTCLRCMSCETLYDCDTAETFVTGEDGEERCQDCHNEFVKGEDADEGCTHDWYYIDGDDGEMKCAHCGGVQN